MNPVLMVAYNNLDLTKQAVDSALAQTIPVHLTVINNGSTDGTHQWLSDLAVFLPNVTVIHLSTNTSVVKVANQGVAEIFKSSPYLLGIPNDVILPPNAYQELLKWPRGFVCASDNGQVMPDIRESKAVSECTPMAVMLTRKWAWAAIREKDGFYFDEGFVHYASDPDLALRMVACGIRGIQTDVPFWHYGSASWRLAPPLEQSSMLKQADEDRDYFERKWGFRCDSDRYANIWKDLNFRAEPQTHSPREVL